jgi:hypothetical protein
LSYLIVNLEEESQLEIPPTEDIESSLDSEPPIALITRPTDEFEDMQIPVEQCQIDPDEISPHKMLSIDKIDEISKNAKIKSNTITLVYLDIKTKKKKLKKTSTGKSLTRINQNLLPNISKPVKETVKKVHSHNYINLAKS